jgi:DNA-binding HxlR family transcriptional regulator
MDFRCQCPISSALDIIGDKWTLLIIRDMLFSHKKTFKDFSTSKESIASNILSSRLKLLEEVGIIRKNKKEDNLKSNIYTLTESGLALLPVIAEITLWSDENVRNLNPNMVQEDYHHVRTNKQEFLAEVKGAYLRSIDFLSTPLREENTP